MKKALLGLLLLGSCAFAQTFTAYTASLPPFTISMKQMGIGHELVTELSKRTGHTFNIKYKPWKVAQSSAQKDPNGLIFSISRTSSREPLYNWLVELTQAGTTFVTLGKPINSLDEARTLSKIAVLGGTPREKQLKKEGFTNFESKPYTSVTARFLNSKKVDAWYTLDARAKYVFKSMKFDTNKLVLGKAIKTTKLWLAGNKSIDMSIKKDLEKAMAEIKSDGTYDKILKKYLGE